ncbi:MAG: F0F1 ATP synthase subunit B [Bacteroidales bacterium]|nr:F0F1 ATP synthase subunit B [Bacteroidales bacterium]MCF8390978.1 F0F1 ATP synthase subunit B [Bacteroidales bacterium]
MDLVTPGIGLIVWTTLIFLILLFLLKKFAWTPINNAVKTREESIRAALSSADKAKEEMLLLQADNEKIIIKARNERDSLLKEAKEVKETIIEEAKQKAESEAKKLIEQARTSIKNEKFSAINEIKEQVAILSVEIAEKILREKLANDKEQKDLLDKLLKDIKLN